MAKYLFIGGLLALVAGVVGLILSFRNFVFAGPEWISANVVNAFLILFGITFLIAGFERGE